MGKEERKLLVLELLGKSDLALPPKVIFLNLKKRGATFERRTLTNYLNELEEEGYIEQAADTPNYWQITDEGRRYLLSNK